MVAVVTGASGFIGKALVARLLARGDEVRALLLPGEDAAGLQGARVVRGDVRDPESVAAALAGARRRRAGRGRAGIPPERPIRPRHGTDRSAPPRAERVAYAPAPAGD